MRQPDYPDYTVKFILENWSDCLELRLKLTSNLQSTDYIYPKAEWFLQEGNTLTKREPQNSRIPHNSNNLIENLCVMLCDIEQAQRRMLTKAEEISLMAVCTFKDREFTPEIKETAAIALNKMVQYLNR